MMFADAFPPVTIPSWVERIALPKYPIVPFAAYVLLGVGMLLLLIGYFVPIKKLPALLAALALLAYYPLSYLALWFLFRFDEQERAAREPSKFEDFLIHHTHVLDWCILGVCAFFGLVFFMWTVWATVRKQRRRWRNPTAATDNLLAVQPISQQQAASRSAAAASPPLKTAKKPPAPPASDNPLHA
ncbi:MAG: hypothetical protein ACYC3I_07695 [Gemmataceae bacterium]